jgi:hypothetical protein
LSFEVLEWLLITDSIGAAARAAYDGRHLRA